MCATCPSSGCSTWTVDGLIQIQHRLDELLARQDADIDGWYYSPAARLSDDDETIERAFDYYLDSGLPGLRNRASGGGAGPKE